jgi:hypothetical protein
LGYILGDFFLKLIWDRCYDFKNIFAEKFSEKLALLTRNKAELCKILIITLVFEKKRQFFRRKSQKIVIITSTPASIHPAIADYEAWNADQQQQQQQPEVEELDRKPERFVTGHRIPLELFSADTLKRIELLPEPETAAPAGGRYVNSESFRGASASASEAGPEPRPPFFQDDRETLLGAKVDPNYRRTLIKFLPDY